jgi:PAP2 superfamily
MYEGVEEGNVMIPQFGKVLALFAVLFVLASPQGLSAEGLRGGFDEAFGPRIHPDTQVAPPGARHRPHHRPDRTRAVAVSYWNQIAIDASALDHTPGREDGFFGEQLGPVRTSYALAIVHIAIFDAVNAIAGGYESYTGLLRARPVTSVRSAIAQAAYDTLVFLYPSPLQKVIFDESLAEALGAIPEGQAKSDGIALGHSAAAAIRALRVGDGYPPPPPKYEESRLGTDYFPSDLPGNWRQDPISLIPIALGVKWGEVTPFVLKSGDQFRTPLPPALGSMEYTAAYNEVKRLGGCGNVAAGCAVDFGGFPTQTERSPEQTEIGIYWGYDGTPGLGVPPRLYNQIAMQIAHKMGTDNDEVELARFLALVNVAMADVGIAAWESKYHYKVWRPVTGIRESDAGPGQTGDGAGDGNPATVGVPTFTPLGAPASNLTGPNFTPPFPAYPSGHASFGGALFEMLRNFYRTDRIPFTFVSDEFNGVTRDNNGVMRPLVRRSFSSLSQAEEENGQSRIYLGIHWSFDKTEGIAQGRRVADYVFKNMLRPQRHGR